MALLSGACVLAASAASVGAGGAQEPAPSLSLELNGLEQTDRACRMTFVVTNGFPAALDQAGFEIALFNRQGQVDRLTVLDFKDLPAGKTKVRRFDLDGTDCGSISRVLVNSATECSGTGIDPGACTSQLTTHTKSGVVFGS